MSSTMRNKRWAALAACFLLLPGFVFAACASQGPPPTFHFPSVTPAPTIRPGAAGCHPPSPQDTSNLGFTEAQGTTPAMDLWVLFLGGLPRAGQTEKIIWRVGPGFDDLIQIVALGPGGQHLQPLFLQKHSSSTWQRPGGEWGTGFNFPGAGCWDLHVTGGKTVGDVWLVVS